MKGRWQNNMLPFTMRPFPNGFFVLIAYPSRSCSAHVRLRCNERSLAYVFVISAKTLNFTKKRRRPTPHGPIEIPSTTRSVYCCLDSLHIVHDRLQSVVPKMLDVFLHKSGCLLWISECCIHGMRERIQSRHSSGLGFLFLLRKTYRTILVLMLPHLF